MEQPENGSSLSTYIIVSAATVVLLTLLFTSGFQLFNSSVEIITTTTNTDDGVFRCGVAPLCVSHRIVGGLEAAEHSWPWQISLRNWNFPHICGGTIVNKRWILTAKHCVSSDDSASYPARHLSVIAGAHRKAFWASESSRQPRDVVRVISHDSEDVALLELERDLEWTDYVHPVCLPTSDVADNRDCWITGWGDTMNTADNRVLQEAKVPIIPQSTCTSYYGSSVNQFMMCAGFEQGGVDTCQGDSGGPLVCARNIDDAYVLHGVTSWGDGCAEPNKPGVYVRVFTVMDWVDQHTSGDYYTSFTGGIHRTEKVLN